MIKPESKKMLMELGNSPYGRALREFIDDEMAQLSDVSSATSWDDVLGKQKAIKTLTKIFSVIGMVKPVDRIKNPYE